jgi:nitroimidazol reductase NimA-like FMN-containing flavoprotein (pyridoxamine 5'-phosphate oxidase superfamily)
MSKRAEMRMTDDEVAGYIAANTRCRVATNGRDGAPHVVPMSYAVLDGDITFWADNLSQKMKNLQRDQRVSVIIDDGVDFQELRGVLVQGTAELTTDMAVSERVADAFAGKAPEEHRAFAKQMLMDLAAERTVVRICAERMTSWDHRKLGGSAMPQDVGH